MIGQMPQNHRAFLLGFKKGDPDWAALVIEDAAKLPAVQWKLRNLERLGSDKRAVLVGRLSEILGTG